jgi:hypothetical protein
VRAEGVHCQLGDDVHKPILLMAQTSRSVGFQIA